jgi:hypothetical protein
MWLVGLVIAWRVVGEMVRVRPIQQLQKRGDVEGLATVLEGQDVLLQLEAIKALQALGNARAMEVLGTAAKAEEEQVSLAALEALATIGSEQAVEQLASLLVTQKGERRAQVIKALPVEKSAPFLDVFIQALNEKPRIVRQEAAKKVVQLYHSNALSPDLKKKIFHQQRDKITKHHNDESRLTHRDVHADHTHTDRSIEDCLSGRLAHQDTPITNRHVDGEETLHLDWGIGVEFPL